MGYREEGGAVVLTMSREDYNALLMALGYVAGASGGLWKDMRFALGLVNRLNAGNPSFTPYEVPHADPR